jgi:PAS domain S-box-containing protein
MPPEPETLPRVLAVDDRDENLVALDALLRREELTLDVARSGSQALELLLRHEYAVALVDVQMPEMSGFELAKLMRSSARTKAVPIIFVTAGAVDPAAIEEGYQSGAVDLLFKPIDPLVLRSKVRIFLELHRQKRALVEAAQARERLNAELREALDEAARSSALLESVFETAPVGMAYLDRELRFRRVNQALARKGGIAAADHVGRRVTELLPGLPGDELEAIWREVIESGNSVTNHEVVGHTPARPGERRTWRCAFFPLRGRGEVAGVGLVVRDVTPEKRGEELQRFLVGIVGHDLRNPLSVLTTSLQLLTTGGGLGERQLVLAGRMRNATRQMTRLIDDLLDYTRVRGGGIPVVPRPAHVEEVVRPVVDEVRAAHPGLDIVLRGEGEGRGEWDPERLRQVISNLVANAAKHGDRQRPIEVTWRGAGDEVAIEVRNGGVPIPVAALSTIFEPLNQGEGSRPGGIGLGLFIAREVVASHGGRIDVRSDEGGTVFTVRLPRVAARPPAERDPQQPSPA